MLCVYLFKQYTVYKSCLSVATLVVHKEIVVFTISFGYVI